MKCVFLTSPGEILEGLNELKELGYEPITYPSTQDTGNLTDTVDSELAPFFIQTIESYDSPYVRSLRSSFGRMITDPRFLEDDYIVFGESDSTPVTPAEEIRKSVEKVMKEHPDVDIFRLFHKLQSSPVPAPVKEGEAFPFEYLNTGDRTRGTNYVWGMHAVVIPVRSREKIARIFSSYRIPIDNAMEAAHSRGDLKMMVAMHDHFYQKKRVCYFDKTRRYSYRNRKIAVCLLSQGNVKNIQRQIQAMMDQSYPDFHVFAAVKGIPEDLFRILIKTPFHEYMEAGKLTLRYFLEKKGISDFLDTVRDQDLSPYDLFARVTDNTLYKPDYLTNINLFHCEIPQHRSSCYKGNSFILHPGRNLPERKEAGDHINHGSFVFTPTIMQQLREREHCCGVTEQTDINTLLLQLMEKEGCSNINNFVNGKRLQPYLVTSLP